MNLGLQLRMFQCYGSVAVTMANRKLSTTFLKYNVATTRRRGRIWTPL